MTKESAATNKTLLARLLGIARSTLYYVSKKDQKDWELKTEIEAVLREYPAYGARRIAQALKRNRKVIQRVMRKFGIKPYRKRGKKWRKIKPSSVVYPNLLLRIVPSFYGHVWTADFTELAWKGKTVYVATVLDLFSREIVGVAVSLRKGTPLTLQALYAALMRHSRPLIFHSDNGKEYEARAFVSVLIEFGIAVSRSHPGCPWENGYQESFYDKFKVELGDPNRFQALGELVAEIYRTIWIYNHKRIHSALKMPPKVYVRQFEQQKTAVMAA